MARSSRGLAPPGTAPELIEQLGGNDLDKKAALVSLRVLAADGATGTEVARGIAAAPGWLPALVRAMRRGLVLDDRMAQLAAGVIADAVAAATTEQVARALAGKPGALPAAVAVLRRLEGSGDLTVQCLAAFMDKGFVDAVVDTPGALLALIRAAATWRAGASLSLLKALDAACTKRPDAVQTLAADTSVLPLVTGLLNHSSGGGADDGRTVSYTGEEVPFADALRLTAARLLEAIASGGEALASRVVAQPGAFDGLVRLVPSKWECLSSDAQAAVLAITEAGEDVAQCGADAVTSRALGALAEGLRSGDPWRLQSCIWLIECLAYNCSPGSGVPARIADAALPALAAAVCGSTDDETTALVALRALLAKDLAISQCVAQQPGLLRATVAVLDRASSGDGGSGDSSSGKLAAAATMALGKISMDGEAARLLAATEGAAEALAAAVRSGSPDTADSARLGVLGIALHVSLAALPAVLPVLTYLMEGPVSTSRLSKLLEVLEAIQAAQPVAAEAVAREPGLLHHVVRLSSASAAFEGSGGAAGGSSGGGGGGDPCPCCSEPPDGDAQWRQELAKGSDAPLQSLCSSSAGAAAEVAAALGAMAACAVSQPGCHVARAARQLLGGELPLLLPPAAVDALCLAAQAGEDLHERCAALEERVMAAAAEACAVRPAA